MRVWSGGSLETAHEQLARDRLLSRLADWAPATSELEVAFGFVVKNTEIDICAFGPSGIVIGELKRWPGRLTGRQNGDWIQGLGPGDVLKRRNVYRQCALQRARLTDSLCSWSGQR